MSDGRPTVSTTEIMRRIWRTIFLLGFILLVVPCIGVALSGESPWLGQAVYQSSIWVGITLIMLWGLIEVVARSVQTSFISVILLTIAFAAVFPASMYINHAAFFGRHSADLQTWHLLPLFAFIYQGLSILIFGGLVGGVSASVAIFRAFAPSLRSSDMCFHSSGKVK